MDKPSARTVLIIDDEKNMLHMLSAYLRREGYEVVTASNGRQGIAYAKEWEIDFILCDLKMPVMDGLEFLAETKAQGIGATIIMMSAFATVDTAVKAMKNGAYDFITKPFKLDEILCILAKAEERMKLREENRRLRHIVEEFSERNSARLIIGDSQCIKGLLQLSEKVARHETTVLITGESGTGKELIARAIRDQSRRSDKPFVAVNCGSIPETLLESEFFGYVKGAFTGADADKKGLFEEADGGTLFLDEIGELPAGLQVKLLRVLQEREFRPIGSNKNRPLDIRFLAATAKDLEQEMAAGRFRQDLYYRLNVVVLTVPPLRERKEDILPLCEHFLNKFIALHGAETKNLGKEALQCLWEYNWPGNVRELENCMERAVVVAESEVIQPRHLPPAILNDTTASGYKDLFDTCSLKEGKRLLEQKLITKALALTNGNKSQAALILEISYPSLLSKMKELNIEHPSI